MICLPWSFMRLVGVYNTHTQYNLTFWLYGMFYQILDGFVKNKIFRKGKHELVRPILFILNIFFFIFIIFFINLYT